MHLRTKRELCFGSMSDLGNDVTALRGGTAVSGLVWRSNYVCNDEEKWMKLVALAKLANQKLNTYYRELKNNALKPRVSREECSQKNTQL